MDMDVTFSSSRCVARICGFSLIELLMTLSIGVILMGMAVPALSNLLDDNTLNTEINRLVGSLHYARSEAILRKQRVHVCKSLDSVTCDNGAEWDNGWIIFVDSNMDRQHQNDEPLLRTSDVGAQELTIEYGAFPSNNYVTFYPTGLSMGNGTFTFCDARGETAAHSLILLRTGRIRTARTMPDGSPLACP